MSIAQYLTNFSDYTVQCLLLRDPVYNITINRDVSRNTLIYYTVGITCYSRSITCLFTCFIKAKVPCVLWAIDRGTFQNIMMLAAEEKHSRNFDFIKR